MMLRGIRGATTVDENAEPLILQATEELLQKLMADNDLKTEDIASVIFSVTHDLTATFPAIAARNLGWTDVPLLDTLEIPVPGALPRAVRVLLHVNSERSQKDIKHVYLRDAVKLRKDLAQLR